MPTNQIPQRLDQQVRVMKIIVGTLMSGVISFAAIAIFLGAEKKEGGGSLISMMGAGFAVMMIAARMTIGPIMINAQRRRIANGTWQAPRSGTAQNLFPADATDADRLLAVLQTVTILQCALPEGAAFLNLIAYMTEHQVWSLAVVAVLLLWMSSSFPTRDGVSNWIGRQLELIELERGQPT
jgi:hypothetical protein